MIVTTYRSDGQPAPPAATAARRARAQPVRTADRARALRPRRGRRPARGHHRLGARRRRRRAYVRPQRGNPVHRGAARREHHARRRRACARRCCCGSSACRPGPRLLRLLAVSGGAGLTARRGGGRRRRGALRLDPRGDRGLIVVVDGARRYGFRHALLRGSSRRPAAGEPRAPPGLRPRARAGAAGRRQGVDGHRDRPSHYSAGDRPRALESALAAAARCSACACRRRPACSAALSLDVDRRSTPAPITPRSARAGPALPGRRRGWARRVQAAAGGSTRRPTRSGPRRC